MRKYLWDDEIIPRERAAAVLEATITDFAARGYGLWAVSTTTSDAFIGFCGFRPSETGEPELLYGLAPHWWGKGLATEAAHTVLAYGFQHLGLPRVVAATDVPNLASVRVLERIGMRFERRGRLNGLDTFFYSLTRTAYVAAAAVKSDTRIDNTPVRGERE